MKYILILLFISQLLSCRSIKLVDVEKALETDPGKSMYYTTHYSKYKKNYNHRKHERTYYLHQEDTVYQIANTSFDPVYKGDSKHQAGKWYLKRKKDISVTGTLTPVELKAYDFYLNKLTTEGKKYDMPDLKHCYQTHFFADSASYEMGDNIKLKEEDIASVSITAPSISRKAIPLFLAAGVLVAGGVVLFVLLLRNAIQGAIGDAFE